MDMGIDKLLEIALVAFASSLLKSLILFKMRDPSRSRNANERKQKKICFFLGILGQSKKRGTRTAKAAGVGAKPLSSCQKEEEAGGPIHHRAGNQLLQK